MRGEGRCFFTGDNAFGLEYSGVVRFVGVLTCCTCGSGGGSTFSFVGNEEVSYFKVIPFGDIEEFRLCGTGGGWADG